MSSSVVAGVWVAFNVGLLLGLWAEEAELRSPWRPVTSAWVPVALGVLRAELVTLLGLMVLLVLQPVSWVPFAALAVLAALVGRVRFMQVIRRRCLWWSVAGAGLVGLWPAVVVRRAGPAGLVSTWLCPSLRGLRGSEGLPANCSSFLLVSLNHIGVVYEWEVSVFEGLGAGVAVDGTAVGRGGEVLSQGRGARGVLTPVTVLGDGSSVGVVPAFWKGVEEQ